MLVLKGCSTALVAELALYYYIAAERNWRESSRSMQTSPGEQSVPLQGEEDAHSRLYLQQ